METVVGVFDTDLDTERALSELDRAGFNKDNIEMVAVEGTTDVDEASGQVLARDDAERRESRSDETNNDMPYPPLGVVPAAVPGGVVGVPNSQGSGIYAAGFVPTPGWGHNLRNRLHDLKVSREDIEFFVNAAKEGGSILVVKAEDERAGLAARIMRESNGVTQDRYKADYQ